jgi:hypothetical protein
VSDPLTRRRFVENLARVTLDASVSGELRVLKQPPGRQPHVDDLARSEWFNGLDDDDQAMVADVMRQTAYAVLHSVLCVLDGVATIVEGPDKGMLRLVHETSDSAKVLNDHAGEPELHDLLADLYGRDT